MKDPPPTPAEQPPVLIGEAAALEADITPEMDAYHREWARQSLLNRGIDPQLVAQVFGGGPEPLSLRGVLREMKVLLREMWGYAWAAIGVAYIVIGFAYGLFAFIHTGELRYIDMVAWPLAFDSLDEFLQWLGN